MTSLAHLIEPDKGQPATNIHLVDKSGLDVWLASRPERVRGAVNAQGFKGEANQIAILPEEGAEWSVVAGIAKAGEPGSWCLAKAAEALPEGTYRVDGASTGAALLGWLLGQYRFDRFKTDAQPKGGRVLLTSDAARITEAVLIAEATCQVRDLVNLPAADLGPAELADAVGALGEAHGATVTITTGAKLAGDYPMIHAVGRAATAARAPRLIELEWGHPAHPRIAVIGKGVVFDSGGLDIKPASGMRLMKKDMGGAAHALALARIIITSRLPVRLHLLIPAAENAIAGDAFRPGDILKSRKGLTVEVGNTDAEGRLILADAITKAGEANPELILDFATLTGAARVALGPDLPAFFANEELLAADFLAAAQTAEDPVWRMPLWKPYHELFASDVADISNTSDTPFAGAVTAALFLQKFVPDDTPWAHLDTFAWRASAKPGRPKGGEALGLRAAWRMLATRYGG